jgi:hypothetical protein
MSNEYRFECSYVVPISAGYEEEAIRKFVDCLARVDAVSLRLWLSTHYKLKITTHEEIARLSGCGSSLSSD